MGEEDREEGEKRPDHQCGHMKGGGGAGGQEGIKGGQDRLAWISVEGRRGGEEMWGTEEEEKRPDQNGGS